MVAMPEVLIPTSRFPPLRSLLWRAVAASLAARDYLKQMAEADVNRVSGAKRDPARVTQLLRSLARNVATEAPTSSLAGDAGGANGPLARDTVYDYLED